LGGVDEPVEAFSGINGYGQVGIPSDRGDFHYEEM